MANSNNPIQILRNKVFIETIVKFSNYSHLTCVNQFDAENDIFELRSQGSGEVGKFLFLKFMIVILTSTGPFCSTLPKDCKMQF